MNRTLIAGLVISSTVLSGCASNKIGRAYIASEAKTAMIGMSKTDLLSCAGAPVNSASDEENKVETLTYIGSTSTSYTLFNRSTTMTPYSISARDRGCVVSFVLIKGKVAKVNYAGDTGPLLAPDETCAAVVQNCI